MIIILFIQIISGLCFFVRVLEHFKTSHLFELKLLTKIGTTYFIWIVFGSGIYGQRLYLSFLWIFSPIIFLFMLEILIKKRRERLFCDQFIDFIDSIILQMKVGRGFREAYCSLIQASNTFFQRVLIDIYEAVVFSQQIHGKIQFKSLSDVIIEIERIDKMPHQAVKRLKLLKTKLKVEQSFRKKVGQLLMQTRIQSFVLVGLYVALFIFITTSYGFYKNWKIIVASAFLFFVGFLSISLLGRTYKWKL